jgi:hypothetical protein
VSFFFFTNSYQPVPDIFFDLMLAWAVVVALWGGTLGPNWRNSVPFHHVISANMFLRYGRGRVPSMSDGFLALAALMQRDAGSLPA